ncbi:MAG: JAB domain-containing protein [Candidatus Coproplasma sp.]
MHEGHRQRLLEKLKSGDNLYEHELLEILLFNAYPRKNVNPIAHALLERFAGIKAVLTAEVDELCAVDGVGENVALYLSCLGKCVYSGNECDSFAKIGNTAEFKAFISTRFRGKVNEVLEFYLLDKTGRVKRICSFTNGDAERVDVKPEDVIKLISVHKPYGVYVAHNHVRGGSLPSPADDQLTKQVQLICSLNNSKLYDHCIYAGDSDIYSYFMSDRLEKIKENFSVANILNNEK